MSNISILILKIEDHEENLIFPMNSLELVIF